jgi:hypothetical protein
MDAMNKRNNSFTNRWLFIVRSLGSRPRSSTAGHVLLIGHWQ